jgi:APA family basic amino acid/polyamine antiporter
MSGFTTLPRRTLAGSRVAKQMGDDGSLPMRFGESAGIPTIVILGIMIASLGLGTVGSITLVANFGVIFSYMLSEVEAIIVRRRLMKSQFVSLGFQYLQIFSLMLSTIMVVSLGEKSLIVGIATLLIGLIIHILLNEFKQNTNLSTHIK